MMRLIDLHSDQQRLHEEFEKTVKTFLDHDQCVPGLELKAKAETQIR